MYTTKFYIFNENNNLSFMPCFISLKIRHSTLYILIRCININFMIITML